MQKHEEYQASKVQIVAGWPACSQLWGWDMVVHHPCSRRGSRVRTVPAHLGRAMINVYKLSFHMPSPSSLETASDAAKNK